MASSPSERQTEQQIAPSPVQRWWWVLAEFALHVFVATAIFVIIFAPAIGLNFLVVWLESLQGDGLHRFVVLVCTCAEYMVLTADVTLLLVFLVKTTWRIGCKL